MAAPNNINVDVTDVDGTLGIPSIPNAVTANGGAFADAFLALDATSVGAGVGGSGTKIVGAVIDRTTIHLPNSVKYSLPLNLTLASGQTATLALLVETSDDNFATSSQYGDNIPNQVINALNSGAAQEWCLNLDVDLGGAGQYVRLSVTPTLSHSGSDTLKIGGVATFFGETVGVPAPSSGPVA